MNVVFLDIDGVLNSEGMLFKLDEKHRALGHHEQCECYRLERMIDDEAVIRLNRLLEATNAKVVISSSWRKLMDPPELARCLVSHGFLGEVIGETPDGPNYPGFALHMLDGVEEVGPIDHIDRGHEIAFWLHQHPEVERFVILDDCSDMAHLKNRLVQTDGIEGLLDEHVELAINMMSWSGKL